MSLDTSSDDTGFRVFIIIPVHNRKDTTLECLRHLAGNLDTCQVVVVDDGSTDGTGAAIQQQYPQVHLLDGDGSLWWTGATEIGMRYAYQQGAQIFIWMNDDCLVAPTTIQMLVLSVQTNSARIVGAQGYAQEQRDVVKFGGKRKTWYGYDMQIFSAGKVWPCDMLSGNLVCFHRSVVDSIGFPDPARLSHYGGDALYLIQARQAGFSLWVDTRTQPLDVPGSPSLYPKRWLLADGKPWHILQLACQQQSIFNWRVWRMLLVADYGVLGYVLFAVKYGQIAGLILGITVLRFLPLLIRQRLVQAKRALMDSGRVSHG